MNKSYLGDIGVHAGYAVLAAADPPPDDPCLHVDGQRAAFLGRPPRPADERPAAVALAGVGPVGAAAGAQGGRVEVEPLAEDGLAERALAGAVVLPDVELDLLHDGLQPERR